MKSLIQDYEFLFHQKPTKRNLVSAFLFNPGFRCVVLLRIQGIFEAKNKYSLALVVSNLNHLITGAEFCVGVRIGVPLIIRHPAGIVVGGGVKVGSKCILLQGVTIGEKHIREPDGLYPIIGNNVSIGCNSSIIGGVSVGHDATIGAHTLIMHDVNPGTTVVGNH